MFYEIMLKLRFFVYTFFAVLLGNDTCVCCGAPCTVLPLCPACQKEHFSAFLPRAARCDRCGRPLVSEKHRCMRCRPREGEISATALDWTMPLFSYRLWRRELLFLWKGRGVRLFTPLFGDLIEKAWPEMGVGLTLIPIPPRPGKIRDKGWDQVEDLCRYLEIRRHIPIARLLCRQSKKQQKKMLGLEGRMENARASYTLRPGLKPDRIPFHIVLLDDVRTTGATLEACAELLKAAGALSVQALTLFGVD
jgi:predicted amidophosphoribosyltransferase